VQHLFSSHVELLLLYGMGFFWTITYLLVIYKGFCDRTCAMPTAALCANITWEFLFSFILPFNQLQQIITVIWFFLDCIILLQFFYYSKKLHPTWPAKAVVLTLLAMALLLHYGITMEFHDLEGKYSAFGINLMMSILFIRMLLIKDLQGQSKYIAYFKMIGTLCASVLCYSQYPHSILLAIMYVLIFILDIVYIILINNKSIKIIYRSNRIIEK
jgi:hypothetical protein